METVHIGLTVLILVVEIVVNIEKRRYPGKSSNDCMNKLSEIRDQEPKNYVGAIAGISYWISFVDPLEGLWKL
jgi:hypothetical protein